MRRRGSDYCIMVLKLGTVFSGIGAIEQALKRLNIQHEIVFACDNGDIDIDINAQEELSNVRTLKTIKEKKDYNNNLYLTRSRRKNFVAQSYLTNYKVKNDNFFFDIRLLDGTDFCDKIDLYVGGSPCQPFSVIGRQAGLEDARGTLFYDYVRVLDEIKPKVFIYENVYGLLKHDNGNTWKVIQEVFNSIGYHYKFEVLDSKDYGIPQGRRRVFVVGFKDENQANIFKFPEKKELRYTMQDFLIDNVKEGALQSIDGELVITENVGSHVDEKYFLSEKLLKYCLSAGTKNFYHPNAKIDLPIARALLSTMGNHHRASVNNYVTTKGRVRSLTVREAHRLMGFPDDYKIVVSKSQAYKQAGNSIVVDVLIALIKEISKVMGWDYGTDKKQKK